MTYFFLMVHIWKTGGSLLQVFLKANVTIQDNSLCNNQYGRSFLGNDMLCASSPGKDTCQVSFSNKTLYFYHFCIKFNYIFRATAVVRLLLMEFRWASPVGETDALYQISLECIQESPLTLTGFKRRGQQKLKYNKKFH